MNKQFNAVIHIVLVLLGLVALLSGGRLLYYFFLVLGIVRLSAYLMIKHHEKNIQVFHSVGSETIQSGEVLDIEYRVASSSFLPISHMEIVFQMDKRLATDAALKEVAFLRSQDTLPYLRKLICPYRGFYEVGQVALKIYDPLMLHQRELFFKHAIDVTVYPKVLPMSALNFDPEDAFGTLKANRRSLTDHTNIVNIRDYERGDPLKNIHWKLSAKQGELLTKEFEETIVTRLVVVLDGYEGHFSHGLTLGDEELMVSFCASLIKALLDVHAQLRLYINGVEPLIIDGSEPGDFQRVLEALTRFESISSTPVNHFINTHVGANDHLVLITPTLTKSYLDSIIGKKKGQQIYAFSKHSETENVAQIKWIDRIMDVAYE